MSTNLTPKQKQILEYIKKRITKNGYAPSLGEIGARFELVKSTIHQHVDSLIEKKYLNKSDYRARSLEIPEDKNVTFVEIPLLGTITAGKPIEAIEVLGETISIPSNGVGRIKDYYALRVSGDSMIDEGIFDGDIVVLKKQSVAENGQTVVAIIDDNSATLKKIYKEESRFRLQPANQTMLPIYRREVEVRGVVIKIIRDLEGQTKKQFSTLDLFAGIGGLRLGFEKAGFKTVFSNDFDKQCKITYDLNFKDSKLIVEDINKIEINDLPEFSFLLGGFPCQAFSIAGYRKGFRDEKGRGNLFFRLAKIIDEREPEGFLLENVKNLKTHDNGKTFGIIKKTLKNLGYHVKAEVLNSMEYGNIPQNRERIYIVGFKNKDHYEKFRFPEPVELTTKITDLLESEVPEKYYYNKKPLFNKLKDFIKERGKVYQWRRRYVRENKKNVCPTLTANMGTGGHNVPIIKDKNGIRKLTPFECARIQGFPVDYKLPKIADSALYKQFGNSVSVPVIEAIAKNIKTAITS